MLSILHSAHRVYFTPNRALSGIALVGLPGTEGRLRIIADSQVGLTACIIQISLVYMYMYM